ncbi:MAG: hypothetical protein U0228_37920 [Myxococcaceae bacterium]
MLYERAKQLQAKGLTGAELNRALLAEGFAQADINVILGSLGVGAQPNPDPTQRPLTVATRVLESRGARALVFSLGALVLLGAAWLVWSGARFVSALVDRFSH